MFGVCFFDKRNEIRLYLSSPFACLLTSDLLGSEDVILHNYVKHIALAEMSPVLEKLLLQGIEEGSIYTDTPKESAEMIVAVLSFILDGTIFVNDIATYNKLKVFANVLNICLSAEKGSFDFLFDIDILQS